MEFFPPEIGPMGRLETKHFYRGDLMNLGLKFCSKSQFCWAYFWGRGTWVLGLLSMGVAKISTGLDKNSRKLYSLNI